MQMLTEKKQVNKLILLFTITYMVSYITRINYGAIISEMERTTKISRSLLSMALTGSFITYGTGQIISGILGDKISPKRLVSLGFIITIAMNVAIPFSPNPYVMLGVWCVNGFAQSLMWPPIVKLMTALLSDKDYKNASVRVTWGSSFGTMFVYLVSPAIIAVSGWRAVFFFSAAAGSVMLFVWNKFSYDIEIKKIVSPQKRHQNKSGNIFNPIMLCVMLAVVLHGMLRDGVTTWMPSYISETYNLSSVISILTGVILPLFGIFSLHLASKLYTKKVSNPVMCAGIFFAIGAFSSVGLYLFTGSSALVSVVMFALLTGCMHGVNLVLICMVPAFFKKYGNVSTASGIINSCTYIGSAWSTYGIALLSETLGWNFTILSWLAIALCGTVLCFANSRAWHKKYQHNN